MLVSICMSYLGGLKGIRYVDSIMYKSALSKVCIVSLPMPPRINFRFPIMHSQHSLHQNLPFKLAGHREVRMYPYHVSNIGRPTHPTLKWSHLCYCSNINRSSTTGQGNISAYVILLYYQTQPEYALPAKHSKEHVRSQHKLVPTEKTMKVA